MRLFNFLRSPDRPPTKCCRCGDNAPAHGYTAADPRVGECTRCHCWGYVGDEHIARRPFKFRSGEPFPTAAGVSGLSPADQAAARKSFKVPHR